MIELQYTPNLEDFIEFNLFHNWTSPEKRKSRVNYYLQTIFWAIVPVALYFVLNSLFLKFDNLDFAIIIYVSVYSIYMLFLLFNLKKAFSRNAILFYSDKLNKSFLEETIIEIGDDEIRVNQKTACVRYSNEAIVKVAKNKEAFYLYVNSIQALIIPKRAINTPEKRDDIENYLRSLKINII